MLCRKCYKFKIQLGEIIISSEHFLLKYGTSQAIYCAESLALK